MDVRRLILRVSLSCLAVTALSAASLLFLPMGGVSGRITLSGLAATVCVALCFPFAAWASRPESRWGGLAGIAFVCSELLLLLSVIWVGTLRPGVLIADDFASAMLYVLVAAPFIIVAARELTRHRVAGIVGVVTSLVGLAFLLVQAIGFDGLDGLFLGDGDAIAGGVGATMLVAGGAAALGLVPAALRSEAAPWTSWWPRLATLAAIAAAGISLWILFVAGTWHMVSMPTYAQAWRTSASLVLGAYAVGTANVVLLPSLTSYGRVVQALTAAAAVATGTMAIGLVLGDGDESIATLMLACLILFLCGAIAVLLLVRFRAEPVLVTDGTLISALDVRCPRCRRMATVPLGASACAGCGLRFRISVEEPRCVACSHLLVGIAGDRCPECGTAIGSEAQAPA